MDSADYLGAGSRLQGAPAATLATSAFAHELRATRYLWAGMGHADMAHLGMLVEAGIVSPADGAILLDAFEDLQGLAPEDLTLDPASGDVYSNRDRMLADLVGHARAGLIHTGRARREATTIAWQLACRERLLRAGTAAAGLLVTLVSVARRHRGSLMPDFTYLHHAQPTTLGHYLTGFAWPLSRDLDRLARALDLVNRSPAGSGSVNGSRLPLDRALAADLLECHGIIEHTRDAMWAPDMALEQMAVALSLATTLDRIAEDLHIWNTAEFGFVELADQHTRTSVVMPQKKNPYGLAYVRGMARAMLGAFTGVAATGLTPSGQPDNRIFAYESVPAALDRVSEALELMADTLAQAAFDTERMKDAAASGYSYATDLCDLLVLEAGIDNRTAHRIVGRAVRRALDAADPIDAGALQRAAIELDLELPEVDSAHIDEVRRPEAIVASRLTPGGAAPAPLGEMLVDLEERAVREVARWTGHPLHGFSKRVAGRVRRLVT
jgi:argininosuccinate lyase